MCEKNANVDSRESFLGDAWACEDCGALVPNSVEECCCVDEEWSAEMARDEMLESQEREDFCECDESYGYYGGDEW